MMIIFFIKKILIKPQKPIPEKKLIPNISIQYLQNGSMSLTKMVQMLDSAKVNYANYLGKIQFQATIIEAKVTLIPNLIIFMAINQTNCELSNITNAQNDETIITLQQSNLMQLYFCIKYMVNILPISSNIVELIRLFFTFPPTVLQAINEAFKPTIYTTNTTTQIHIFCFHDLGYLI
ncbi:hypothetical protein TTHERM_000277587 (macronuclear) [Tetrahymena thermophila SB210]|uniref:Uncharacterized protein n=1 Tax=Tetrahymena thermophila (strain SB210) TaxID=312017 RepID=W7XHJ1_TETTS|nr:hypothetical protein TTHERM_000277587 [Tetrahymena thermophila SB210]EWS73846.1 hypothetical protein TTHERM_000277587 [Tetrahymena thermophila SB210]|eukprot:XP_012653593.1 hypothetical protein TTHERM_000277587 [Tetrahymena thermophila SB210]